MGDVNHDLREAGFRAPLEEAGIEVLDVKPGDSDSEEAMSVMEDFIQKYDKIDAVLCCNDEMAQGAQRAVEQAGLKDVKIIGFGANNFILDPFENGNIAASISINPYDMGKTAAAAPLLFFIESVKQNLTARISNTWPIFIYCKLYITVFNQNRIPFSSDITSTI